MPAITAPSTVTTTRFRIATTAENARTCGKLTKSDSRMLPSEKLEKNSSALPMRPVVETTRKTITKDTTVTTAMAIAARNDSFTADQKSTYTSRRRTCLALVLWLDFFASLSATVLMRQYSLRGSRTRPRVCLTLHLPAR